jgi:hypothetical protein
LVDVARTLKRARRRTSIVQAQLAFVAPSSLGRDTPTNWEGTSYEV